MPYSNLNQIYHRTSVRTRWRDKFPGNFYFNFDSFKQFDKLSDNFVRSIGMGNRQIFELVLVVGSLIAVSGSSPPGYTITWGIFFRLLFKKKFLMEIWKKQRDVWNEGIDLFDSLNCCKKKMFYVLGVKKIIAPWTINGEKLSRVLSTEETVCFFGKISRKIEWKFFKFDCKTNCSAFESYVRL